MAWNGSGTFTRTLGSAAWVGDAAAGTKIVANRHDTNDTDLATGINAALAKNGENAFTGTTGGSALRGAVDNTSDLGSTSLRWRNLYAGTSVIFQGATYATTVTSTPTANRAIVMPDASGTLALTLASRFYAAASGNQVGVVSGVATQVSFGTESYDVGGEYAADTFTPTVTGIYLFNAGVVLATNLTIGTNAQMWFSVNGNATAGAKVNVGGTTTPILNLSWVGSVTAGQPVLVNFQHNLGSNVTLSAGGSAGITFFSGIRLI